MAKHTTNQARYGTVRVQGLRPWDSTHHDPGQNARGRRNAVGLWCGVTRRRP